MNDNWNYNEKNPKKTVLFVLVTIILIMIIAILGLVFFKLLKGNKSPQTAESSITTTIAETTQTTTEATTTTTETTTKKTTTKKVTTTKETTTPAPTTVKATAPKPSITASLEYVSNYHAGWDVYLTVSGDFSYYDWESYVKLPNNSKHGNQKGSSSDTYICICGTFEPQMLGTTNVCIVTPYLNGIKGDTIRVEKSIDSIINSSNNNSTKNVTSCTKYGTIYSPSGSKVDGLTRSYLIDGGAATYERHDLTHGWHVTAVSEYYDGSTYWYELYDSDDGDYYGWVASYNISFY